MAIGMTRSAVDELRWRRRSPRPGTVKRAERVERPIVVGARPRARADGRPSLRRSRCRCGPPAGDGGRSDHAVLAWLGRRPGQGDGDRRRHVRGRRGGVAVAVIRRYPRGWWLPAGAGSVVVGAASRRWRRSARPGVQRLHTPSGGRDSVGRARVGRGSGRQASARSSRWTRAAGGPRPTPTWGVWDRPSAWCCSTRCSIVTTGTRSEWSSRTSWPTSAIVTSRAAWPCLPRSSRRAGAGGAAARAGRCRPSAERPRRCPRWRSPAAIVSGAVGVIGDRLSRAIERRADDFSLRAHGRARGVHLLRADDRAAERRRPGASALADAGCWPPIRRPPSGSARRWPIAPSAPLARAG